MMIRTNHHYWNVCPHTSFTPTLDDAHELIAPGIATEGRRKDHLEPLELPEGRRDVTGRTS